ncbi:peptide/nickel transport system substrate-binding protein [Chelatococcus caeni]|uniref:Peptide/nickel transport system substrate-binding protein n=1 Tax=Chelatococcus caeni TaxID=1348468 RepID=A0A840C0L0_9HYPH|nr:ABC transporter substrate-binding protein [Chelatococcus caeni]MBB4018323.1 peptide/nickel transport system substrate-binding protein [Chelatococcus caeni]
MNRSCIATLCLALTGPVLFGLPQAASAAPIAVAVDSSPSGLDPHIVTAFSSFQIIEGTIYEGLTALDKSLSIVPGLAESWTISEDGKTYAFKLRSGVKFHSGAAMTSADVAASLQRVMKKETGSPLASRLATVEGIDTPDAETVVIRLSAPTAPLLSSLSSIAIVPAKYLDDVDTLQRKPDGTGAFKFAEWQPNVAIRLVANPDYWQAGLPKLEGVNFDIVPEAATRQVGLASNQYQMLPNINAVTALQLKGQPGVELVDTLELSYTLVGMNVTHPLLGKAKVREAINYAINRDDIVNGALLGAGVPGGPLSPALKQWAASVDRFACFKHDPAKAKALLQEAGVAGPVSLKLLVLPRDDTRAMAQIIQQQLAAVGIDVTLTIPEIGQFVQDWRNSNFDLFISANAGTTEPDDYFYRSFRTGGSTNVFKYSNPELDAQLDRGRAEVDPAARRAIYNEVQSVLACSGPAAFLTYAQLYTGMRSSVEGFDILPNRSLGSLKNVTLK